MDSIPKFLASILTVIVGILFCISFIISSTVVNSARTYHASIIDDIEASNYEEITIQNCMKAAEEDGYSLTIETVSGAVNEARTMYKVTLDYGLNAPIFSKMHTGTLSGYALSGTHLVEPTIEIPKNPVTGDVFIYNDYEYRYNMYFVNDGTWDEREAQNGWGARVLDDSKTEYKRPLSMVGDTKVVCLDNTYFNCENLEQAPLIPETVVYMQDTFKDCVKLKEPAVIPSSVEFLNATFYGCVSLKEMPNLENAESLEEMNSTFVGCTSLPEDLSDFEIPSTVSSGCEMFMGCTQLVAAPVIPDNLMNIVSIFENCTSLTGTVYVHCDPVYCQYAFNGTVKPILIDGSCSDETKADLAATSDGNVEFYAEETGEAA